MMLKMIGQSVGHKSSQSIHKIEMFHRFRDWSHFHLCMSGNLGHTLVLEDSFTVIQDFHMLMMSVCFLSGFELPVRHKDHDAFRFGY